MSIIDEWLILCKAQVQGSGFTKLNKQIQTTRNSLFDARNLFRAFIGYDIYSGIKQFATTLVQSTRDLGAMTSRFYAITKSEKLANEELQWTFDLAEKTAMGLKATADSYSIFYSATQKSLGTGGARQVFQDWTEVSRVLHLSEYQFERVTYALREMASKGAIYSQDLRMQIGTHVPNAMGLAQKAVNELGITGNDWFDKFQKKAKGNQQLINQFIVLFSKYAKQAYASPEALAKSLEQPDAQIQRLYNTWQKFIYSLAGGQFQKDLVSLLKIANSLLEVMTKHAGALYTTLKAILGVIIAIQATALFGLFKRGFFGKAGLRFLSMRMPKWLAVLVGFFTGKTFLTGLRSIGALLLPFLTNPYVLGALLIVACLPLLDWFLKKFFPNVWLRIHLILDNITYFFQDLFTNLMRHPFIQMLQKLFGGSSIDNQLRDEAKKIQDQGGLLQDGKLNKEGIAKMALLSSYKTAQDPLVKYNPIAQPFFTTGMAVKHTIDIVVNGNNVAQQVGADNLDNAIEKNKVGLLGAIKNAIKGR